MSNAKGNNHFRLMSFSLWLRDVFFPPTKKLQKAELKPGDQVLDFGCGPGSFSLAAARIVGPSGKVYALDIHPLALRNVQRKASKRGLQNIKTISSDRATELADQSVNMVILNDVLHEVDDPDAVLSELHRILKPDGTLFFSDHHIGNKEALTILTQKGLFQYSHKGYRALFFSKKGDRHLF